MSHGGSTGVVTEAAISTSEGRVTNDYYFEFRVMVDDFVCLRLV